MGSGWGPPTWSSPFHAQWGPTAWPNPFRAASPAPNFDYFALNQDVWTQPACRAPLCAWPDSVPALAINQLSITGPVKFWLLCVCVCFPPPGVPINSPSDSAFRVAPSLIPNKNPKGSPRCFPCLHPTSPNLQGWDPCRFVSQGLRMGC